MRCDWNLIKREFKGKKKYLAEGIYAASMAFIQAGYNAEVDFKESIEPYRVFVLWKTREGENKIWMIYDFYGGEYVYNKLCEELGI